MADDSRRNRWQIFKSWHRTESLWQEIYARSVSGLIVLLIVYLVGVLGGVFNAQPLRVILVGVTIFFLVPVVPGFLRWRAERPELKAVPRDDPGREEAEKKLEILRLSWQMPLGVAALAAIAVWGADPGKPWWVVMGGG